MVIQTLQVASETKAVVVIRKKGIEEQNHIDYKDCWLLINRNNTRTLIELDLLAVNVPFLEESSLKDHQCKIQISGLL